MLDRSPGVVDEDGVDRGSTLEGGTGICKEEEEDEYRHGVFDALGDVKGSHLLAGNCALLLRDRSRGLYSDSLLSAASAGVDWNSVASSSS